MLDIQTADSILKNGGTFAKVAKETNVRLPEAYRFCLENNLSEPTTLQVQKVKLLLQQPCDHKADEWERLLVDGTVINGIDTVKMDDNVRPSDIVSHYHGESRCYYTDAPTDIIMMADGDQQNLLISNLVPICTETLEQRFRHTMVTTGSSKHQFGPLDVTVQIEHRFDRQLGSCMNGKLLKTAFLTWIAPYGQFLMRDVMACFDLPPTPDMLALWVWQQLEKKALLKGLSSITVANASWSASVTKHQILNHTRQMLARQFGQRSVVTPAVRPPGGGPAPSRLIKL